MSTVYVRWYGSILQGEVVENRAEGLMAGMVAVRIQVQGMHATALFTPQHVYDSPEKVNADSPTISPKAPLSFPELPAKEQISTKIDVMPVNDREKIETFKRENWDAERGHLRIDKLDEFYQLWRMVIKPADFVETDAPKRIVSDERMEELKQKLKTTLGPKPTPKSETPKPSKKMLRSSGVQQFNDSKQLALFDI